MTANNVKVHTKSEQKTSPVYVKKTAVHETIKCRIEKFQFESLVDSYGKDDFLCSGEIPTKLSPRAFWELHIYPGNAESVDFVLSLAGVSREDYEQTFYTLSHHLYLVREADGKIDSIMRRNSESDRHDYDFDREHEIQYYDAEIYHYIAKRALQADGSLVVAVDVKFIRPESDLPGYEQQQRWVAKLSEFCGDEATSDCCIKIGGETLPAHKLFLMACSTAFRTMFTSSAAEESKSSVVEIEDFEHPEAMQALIQYCNSGCLDAEMMDGEWSEETFKMACKYFIDDLKALLERHYIDEALCLENVVDLAVLADSHNAGELKAACIQLIVREVSTVFKSAEWKELKEAEPTFTTDLAEGAATLLATPFTIPPTPPLQVITEAQELGEQEAGEETEYKGTMHTEFGRKVSHEYVKRDLVHLTIQLRIEEIESLMNSCGKDDCLYSKGISSEWAPGVVWKLEVHPNSPSGHVGVRLGMTGSMVVCGLEALCTRNISHTSLKLQSGERETLEDLCQLYLVDGAGGQIDKIDHDEEGSATGSLVVAIDIDFLASGEGALHGYEHQQRWVAKLSEYFADPTTSDCCIKIGGVTLPAHKLPLMACSRVLHEKFTDPTTEESKSGIVNVTDSKEPEAMRAILYYCRRGCLDVETMDGEWSEEIFKLARCYRIDDLVALLEEHYIESLCVENAVAMAVRADTHHIDKLKEACIKLIASEEGKTVFDSAEWKELEEANVTLAAELAAEE